MGKVSKIDGEKLYKTVRASKNHVICQFTKDEDIIGEWHILFSWRKLKGNGRKVQFFRVHCQARNKEVFKKENESIEKEDPKIFWDYMKKYHTPASVAEYRYGVHNFIPNWEFIEYPDWHPLIRHHYKKTGSTAVIEIFRDKKRDRSLDEVLKKELIPREKNKTRKSKEFSGVETTSWGLIDRDRQYEEPVIYLRINLLKYKKPFLKEIDKLIVDRRKELQIKPHDKRRLNFKSWEVALMLFDLYTFGISEPQLLQLLNLIDEDIDMQYVKDKIKMANTLIDSSITVAFPKFK